MAVSDAKKPPHSRRARSTFALSDPSSLESGILKCRIQNSGARIQNKNQKRFQPLILASEFWFLNSAFHYSSRLLIRSRSDIGLMGLVMWALKPDWIARPRS